MSAERTNWFAPRIEHREYLDPVEKLSLELTEEDRKLVAWISEQIVIRRLTPAALFFLESSKPLNFVSSQLLVVLSPILGAFVPRVRYNQLVSLLEKRPFIELLLRALEAREDEFIRTKKEKTKQAGSADQRPTTTTADH